MLIKLPGRYGRGTKPPDLLLPEPRLLPAHIWNSYHTILTFTEHLAQLYELKQNNL